MDGKTKKWRLWLVAALWLVFLIAVLFTKLRQKPEPQRYTATWFDVFDTVSVIQGYAESEEAWNEQMEALHADLLRLHRLYDIYNHYDGMVNLYDLNIQAAQGPVTVPELYGFLEFATQMTRETGGACNIAAGAVLTLWHTARENGVLPAEAMLEVAAKHCGIGDVQLNGSDETVFFSDPALKLDVGAVAKGYAIDLAAQWAIDRGLDCALLNVGGSVRAIGTKPDGSAWTAGVENPWPDEQGQYHLADLAAAVRLDGKSTLVISGDYQRYTEIDGVRYHHLIDLSTLQPARYYSSVAVLAVSSGVADAYSTALFCLPPEESMALAQAEESIEVLWLLPDGTTMQTDGWDKYALELQ